MKGNQYFYHKDHSTKCNGKGCDKSCKHEELPDAIKQAVIEFTKKYGYRPEFAVVRLDEYIKGKYPIPVKKVVRSCQSSHFILYPIADRTPRIFIGERIAWQQK